MTLDPEWIATALAGSIVWAVAGTHLRALMLRRMRR
jgi:hypothetical protein